VWEDTDLACTIAGTLVPKSLERGQQRVYEAMLGFSVVAQAFPNRAPT